MGDIPDELNNAQGVPDDKKSNKVVKITELIKLPSVNLILGTVGSGKSGCAYYLMENLSEKYDLLPVVINLPKDKRNLLPEKYLITDLEGMKKIENCIALVDEGTTNIPVGSKELEEMIKGFNSLVRQRNQIIIFIFHPSSDVGSRILHGVNGAIIFKEPDRRQIQWGSKDKWIHDLLITCKEKMAGLAEIRENTQEWALVDNLKPDYQGMAKNGLPTYWSDELSKAWKDTDLNNGSSTMTSTAHFRV